MLPFDVLAVWCVTILVISLHFDARKLHLCADQLSDRNASLLNQIKCM